MSEVVTWSVKHFSELSTEALYELLKLRVDIFVVEQACYYPELDNKDLHPDTLHLCGYTQTNEDKPVLAAYARLLPQGVSYEDAASLGRVAVSMSQRKSKRGHELMQRALVALEKEWPSTPIKISAQCRIEGFYQSHGFNVISKAYLEDGIPHQTMLRGVTTLVK